MFVKKSVVPQVSIGMPVFNGENLISEALDSLLCQTFEDYELIISDNASTDRTELICRKYASKDERIKYYRHNVNQGAAANFQFVLQEARSEYFMWASHDDWWGCDFIRENIEFLRGNSEYVGSISQTVASNGRMGASAGSSRITDSDKWMRVEEFVKYPAANARFYSLWRKAALRGVKLNEYNYAGGDWAVVSLLLMHGKLNCIEGEVQFYKRRGASADLVRYFDSVRVHGIEYLVPYYRYSRDIIRLGYIKNRTLSRAALIVRLNARAAVRYWLCRLSGKS